MPVFNKIRVACFASMKMSLCFPPPVGELGKIRSGEMWIGSSKQVPCGGCFKGGRVADLVHSTSYLRSPVVAKALGLLGCTHLTSD